MQLVAQYRDRADQPAAAFELHLQRLYPLLEVLGKFDPTLEDWYLKADVIELARLHPVFQAQKPALAALAVLRQKYIDRVSDPKSIALWNGKDSKKEGAALTVTLDTGVLPSELDLTMGERSPADSRLGLYETVAEIVSAAALIYDPAYVTFGPRRYFSKQVFDSRPGASWLLYLPRTLSVDQVPEARSLIPVLEGKKQKGTIVVSVIDETFSADNAEHVKVANAIETRLADQDLLPRYAEI